MCPHTAIYVSLYYYICVLILLHMCPHAAIYVSSYYYRPDALAAAAAAAGIKTNTTRYYYICVLMLLYMCPHITTGLTHWQQQQRQQA